MSHRRIVSTVTTIVLLAGCLIFWMWRGGTWSVPAANSWDSRNDKRERSISPQSRSSLFTAETLSPRRQWKHVFEILNHNPIEFYGRAIDQFGEPVGAADVQGSVLYNTGVKSGVSRAQTITDAQGNFQFTNLVGQDLGIGIEKAGYEYHVSNSSFSFSYFEADHKRHQPDPSKPVVFVLWKKQGAEPLIHYDHVWRFPLSSSPVKINLRSGKMDEQDPDIIVSVSRNPVRMRYGYRGFAWSTSVEVVDGGLIRIGSLDYYNLAPESGYQPRFNHAQEAHDLYAFPAVQPKWSWDEKVADDFFISSHQGRNFAHVALKIWPNSDHQEGDNEALVEAEVWLNPNGSRNLEFDPEKVIPLPRNR